MRTLLLLTPVLCTFASPAIAGPVISEFCASNQTGLTDEDGSHSDWLEIHNPDATPADLTGWYLTDNAGTKTKWQFPATTLAPNGYLVVFASNNNRRTPGAPLHTNFALSAGGEYLGLIKPDGVTVASQYSPSFPAQFSDVSYGVPSNIAVTPLVASTASCQWLVPTSASNPASTWKNISFSTTGWNSGTMGIGYDRNVSPGNVDYRPLFGTNSDTDSAMTAAGNPSCYVRIPFNVPVGTVVSALQLRAKYDDGYAVWLNGQPLISSGVALKRNAPVTLNWNSAATANHDDPVSIIFEDADVSGNIPNLVEGANVLSVQSMNSSTGSSDHLLNLELNADVVIPGPASAPGYFAVATPGTRNSGPSGLVIPQPVTFSKNSGTFTGTFTLALGGAVAGQIIRYTLDGSMPTSASTQYAGTITVSGSALVRARIFEPSTGAVGFVNSMHYEQLAAELSSYGTTGAAFKSALPIIVLNNNNTGEPANDNIYRDTRIQIYDRTASGYSSLATTAAPTLTLNAGVKLRGRSSSGFPKKSYGIEVRNETGDGKDVSILGMPAGEDWALIGGWEFDRAFMRNAWIYEISRQAGRWAPRTRLVEVYFNQDGNNLANADYRGVYILCETIRNGSDRVDVAKLETADVAQPEVSGGYIFKVDPPESDEFSWRTIRGLPLATDGCSLVIHRPKLDSLATAQSGYLNNYFQQFENAAFNEAANGFITRNYRNYIDSAAWADHNLFCAVTKNVDALRLSAYYHKDRGEKMSAGPLWDFDRSSNSSDGRDDAFTGWRGTGDATDYHTFAWWQPLFQDVEFRQVYVDRWHALRSGALATANVNAVLDGYLAEFKPADTDNPASRDYAKWYGSATSNNITTETNVIKNWIANRSAWIDSQFAGLPVIARASGPVAAGQTTTISIPSGTTVYYTTNGTDPRLEGGGISPGALIYSSAVPIPATTRLIARAFRTGTYAVPATNWSGTAEALYLVNETYGTSATLQVSAVNYHPLAPTPAESNIIPGVVASDFEWIELRNVSTAPVNLQGISLVKDNPVSALTLPAFTLAPGTRAVVAKNSAAFQLRYGAAAAARVVATWTGYPSLDDNGTDIRLFDRSGASLADFEYDDEGDWPTRADGAGSSLEYIGATNTQADYENPLLWKSSTAVHGSPGLGDPVRTGVVINEILSRSSAPDAIELHNPGATTVDLSGWYLSNSSGASTESDYRQFRIPNGTQLVAGGYRVFNETNFNPTPATPADTDFSLDGARGGSLWLISADPVTGKFLNFEQKEDYPPTLSGVSFGRSPNGSGALVPLGSVTLAAANSAPRIGGVQVGEIHYHPAATTPEFVEISNTGAVAETLTNWTLRGDVDFDFPPGFTLSATEAVVVVSFNPAVSPTLDSAFRSQYGVAAGVRLVGPWSAGDSLSDTAGTIRLRRRVPPPEEDPAFVGLMLEDEVNYLSTAPWPTGGSGSGSSIRRLGIFRQASDPTAWIAQAPTPGSGVGGYLAWQLGNFSLAAEGAATADGDQDDLPNLVEYLLGSDPHAFTRLNSSIDPNGGSPRFVLDYTLRLDRDDASLTAGQSTGLETWIPAQNDSVISSDGVLQQRRAWLPVDEKGFLRLKATTEPASN
ncbi:MAG: lamin tail domain-containing protein [Verrucomicrobiota bacterium]